MTTIFKDSTMNVGQEGTRNIGMKMVSENMINHGLYGCHTCYESFERSVSTYHNYPCLGERSTEIPDKPGPFIFKSYKEVKEMRNVFAAGLLNENLLPKTVDGLYTLGIVMKNCINWVIAEQACYYLGVVTVPIFDAFKNENMEYIIRQACLRTILCSPSEARRLIRMTSSCPIESIIINCNNIDETILMEASANSFTGKIFSWKDILASGRRNQCSSRPPSPKDIATICYTSGTTGEPKGAIISHLNLVTVAGAGLAHGLSVNPGDTYLSFLPLPHIFERLILTALISCGATIGFYRGDPLGIIDDLKAIRPMLFCAVPRLLNKIRDKVVNTGCSAPGIKGILFRKALQNKTYRYINFGITKHYFWDKLIFIAVRRALGLDRVKILLSGGAPLAKDVMIFFRILLGDNASCHEGYGQTETTGGTTMTRKNEISTDHVGVPIPSVEIRLQDVPEMNYFNTDTIHNGRKCKGRGQVCVRGKGVFSGYYKNPVETANIFTPDGWLMSGDIGMFTDQNQLVIIDRIKNLIKLSQGEYVAVEYVETVLNSATLISQIFVHGDSTENCLVAIVVPDEDEAKKWIMTNNSNTDNLNLQNNCNSILEYLSQSEDFRQAILDQLTFVGKNAGLTGIEIVKNICIESKLWLPGTGDENSLLTPTLKLRRDLARNKYKLEIKRMYDALRLNNNKILSKL